MLALLLLSTSLSPVTGSLPAAERNALVDLFNSTAGSWWSSHAGWAADNNVSNDPCTMQWSSVTCSTSPQHVVCVHAWMLGFECSVSICSVCVRVRFPAR